MAFSTKIPRNGAISYATRLSVAIDTGRRPCRTVCCESSSDLAHCPGRSGAGKRTGLLNKIGLHQILHSFVALLSHANRVNSHKGIEYPVIVGSDSFESEYMMPIIYLCGNDILHSGSDGWPIHSEIHASMECFYSMNCSIIPLKYDTGPVAVRRGKPPDTRKTTCFFGPAPCKRSRRWNGFPAYRERKILPVGSRTSSGYFEHIGVKYQDSWNSAE